MKIELLNISEEDRQTIYKAVNLIEYVISKNKGTYFSSYINDFENDSIIELTLTNSKNENI